MKTWMVWKKTVLPFLLGLVLTACAAGHPLPQAQWPVDFDPLFVSLVWIETGHTFSEKTANGVILHSTREHGTYVLTTTDSLSGSGAKVAMYHYSHESMEEGLLGIYRMDAIMTDPERNLVLARLNTKQIFKTVRLHQESIPSHYYDKRTDVRIVSISPAPYPHEQTVQVSAKGELNVRADSGSRGSPIFCENKLAGMYSEYPRLKIIGTHEIREFLHENGFSFILGAGF